MEQEVHHHRRDDDGENPDARLVAGRNPQGYFGIGFRRTQRAQSDPVFRPRGRPMKYVEDGK